MNSSHSNNIRYYVDDIIKLERDITNAAHSQLEDDRMAIFPELRSLLTEVADYSAFRLRRFKHISDEERCGFGVSIKDDIAAFTSTLGGLHGNLKKHPVSRMLRDNIAAQSILATSYGLLLTLSLSTNHASLVALAENGLLESARFSVLLTGYLPEVVVAEFSEEAPLSNLTATKIAGGKIKEAWSQQSCHSFLTSKVSKWSLATSQLAS